MGNYSNLLAFLSFVEPGRNTEMGKALLPAMGVTEEEAYNQPYVNVGVLAISNNPTGRNICRRFIREVPLIQPMLQAIRFRDQDYLNVLFCRMGINPAVLEPLKYNQCLTKRPDKRIVHFIALNKDKITEMWKPYLKKVVIPALNRIGLNYDTLIQVIPPDTEPGPKPWERTPPRYESLPSVVQEE